MSHAGIELETFSAEISYDPSFLPEAAAKGKDGRTSVILRMPSVDLAPAPSPAPPPIFPEGGLQAWMAVAGAWLMQFSTFGSLNAFGVYQGFYTTDYLTNQSTSTISWIGSLQAMLLLSAGAVTGRAYDSGYFYHLMIGSTVLLSFSIFMLSLSQPQQYYQVILSQGIGVGLGYGMAYIPSLSIISHYFHRRRAFVMGIVASGASVGGIVHPIMLNNLFYSSVGFHKAVRYSAALHLICMSVAVALMRTRLPPKKVAVGMGQAVNFLREPPYILTIAGISILSLGYFFPIFYIQLDAVSHGVNTNIAFYTVAILNAGSTVGRVLFNLISSRVGILNTLVFVSAASGILVFGMFGVTTEAAVIIFSILYGMTSGATVSLYAPTLASQSREFSEIGARMGICFTIAGLTSLVGTPITGALLTTSYKWWRAITFSGVCLTAGAVSLFAARTIVSVRKGLMAV